MRFEEFLYLSSAKCFENGGNRNSGDWLMKQHRLVNTQGFIEIESYGDKTFSNRTIRHFYTCSLILI